MAGMLLSAACGDGGEAATDEGTVDGLRADIDVPNGEPIICAPSPDDEPTALQSKFELGQERLLRVEQRKQRPDRGEGELGTTETVRLKTVAVEEGGWTFEWEASASELDPELAAAMAVIEGTAFEASAQTALDGIVGLQLEYQLDHESVFLGLTNMADVTETLEAARDEMVTFLRLADPDAWTPEVERFMDEYFGAERLAQNATQPMQVLHRFHDIDLSLGEERRADHTLPNRIGGPDFPAQTVVTVHQDLDEDSCVRVELLTTLDSAETARIIRESMAQQRPASEDGGELVQLDTTFEMTAQYDPSSGWFRNVTSVRTLTEGDQVGIDRIVITDITPPETSAP